MRFTRFLPLAALAWAQACMIYNEGLLDESDSVDASGGATGGKPTSSGGKTSSGGGSQTAGGQNSGGASSDGGRSSGGQGGEKPGSGGASSGGASSDGGRSSGGTSSGGAGTGGAPPAMGPFLVTDMSKSTHSNSPFFGKIDRYNQPGTTWTGTSVSNMLVPRTTGSSDLVLHVAATFSEDGWGIDIAVTLKSGNAFDLSSYKTLSFDLMGVDQETQVRIGLEDFASHRSSATGAPCDADGVGVDCDKHIEALSTPIPGSAWETITLDLDDTTFYGCGMGCDRTNPLDLTRVYAIHFKMDPPEDVDVDFSLDNIYIDN